MAITFRAAGQAAAGSGSVVITKPVEVVDGDVMIVATMGTLSTATAPSGWSQIVTNRQLDISANYLNVWRKVASGEGSTYTFTTVAVTTDGRGMIGAWAGADNTNPIDVVNSQSQASSSNITAPSITTTVANTMLVYIGAGDSPGNDAGDMFTPPSGMTERQEVFVVGYKMEFAEVLQAGIGATGTKTGTSGAGGSGSAGALLALREVVSSLSVKSPSGGVAYSGHFY